MILQPGGLAFGATSTRSRSASAATRSASSMRTMPTCSPPGPIRRTSGTRMRSLTRVSVLMGPPMLSSRSPRHQHSAQSNRKALLKAGPKADQDRHKACDRTAAPVWSAVGVGLHLLSLAYAGTVAHASLAGMTDVPAQAESTAQPSVRELAEIPAVEVITRAAVMLMSAAAEKLGLSAQDPDESPNRDLDEARRLITALAGLVTASVEYLGPHAGPVRDGLKSLQLAFREASAAPEEPGQGPGEKYTGPVW